MHKLKVLNNSILFEFIQQTINGQFSETTSFGLAIIESKDKQLKTPRWGKVLSVGSKVKETDIQEGTYILVEPLMWTTNLEFEGSKVWRTTEDKVLAISTVNPL